MTDLKPCPFCGERGGVFYPPRLIKQEVCWARPMYSIECENCGAIGGNDLEEKDAVIAWNTRAGEDDE